MLAKVLGWLVLVAGFTFLATVILSFSALAFINPFGSELGRFCWIMFVCWVGLRVIKLNGE